MTSGRSLAASRRSCAAKRHRRGRAGSTVSSFIDAQETEKFGMLTEIDVQATMNAQLGMDVGP
jgi:hypothetical protein